MIDREISRLIESDQQYETLAARFAHVTFPGHEIAKRLYSIVFHADFEFYSHFIGRDHCRYQKDPETLLRGLTEGFGGHCMEKNIALKYLFERAGFKKVEWVFGGSIRGSQRPFDSAKADEVGIGSWVSGVALPQILHCSVVLTVDGNEYLFDPNNGRMGPLITTALETEQLLRDENKAYFEMYNGKMYYQRVPQRYHQQIFLANTGDDFFGMQMVERLGLLIKTNFDILVTSIDNGEDALRRWQLTPFLRDVVVAGDDFGFIEGQEHVLPGIDKKTALYLEEARRRLTEIGVKADGYPRYLAIRIFDNTWWEMSRLVLRDKTSH